MERHYYWEGSISKNRKAARINAQKALSIYKKFHLKDDMNRTIKWLKEMKRNEEW